jgi:hypothetical protein
MEGIRVKSAINPKDGIEYFEGDKVVIYQGRLGHNNIIQIKSIWKHLDTFLVSETEEYFGTYITAIKKKISDKEIKRIKDAMLVSQPNYQIKI